MRYHGQNHQPRINITRYDHEDDENESDVVVLLSEDYTYLGGLQLSLDPVSSNQDTTRGLCCNIEWSMAKGSIFLNNFSYFMSLIQFSTVLVVIESKIIRFE